MRYLGLLLVACLVPFGGAHADPVADFYKGKTISLVVSVGEGDGLDRTARMLSRHWPDHLPGHPNIIVKNMPGAGSLRATDYLYKEAARDGTTLGAIIPVFVLQQILGGSGGAGTSYDAAKFGWIGSADTSNQTIFVWHSSGVRSLADAMTKEVVMGGTGIGSNSVLYPSVLDNLIGTRFKIVMGYRSTAEVDLAMERGEVQGRAGASFYTLMAVKPDWLQEKKINVLAQIGVEKEAGFESVPLLTDFAKDAETRAVLQLLSGNIGLGRPYLAPPGVPAERLAALRTGFDAAIKDPALLAEAKQSRLDISPTQGVKLQQLVEDMVGADPQVVARAKAALDSNSAVTDKVSK